MPTIKNTGLFFGSFDPVHIGHMVIANYMLEYEGFEEVWFVVSPHNPLKEASQLLDQQLRLEMVKEAAKSHPGIIVSDIEFSLPVPSYTFSTLKALREHYRNHQFNIIMGSDNLTNFGRWYKYEEIIDDHLLFVYPRKDFDGGIFAKDKNVRWTDAPMMEISSTFIRAGIGAGKDMQFFVPQAVWQYIKKENLYTKR
ncbi:MAG: nicotinate (nicotinamide) nucleotide adenylyltransferase [Bacteroidales bacterium]|nr:nicotinate (nicotinamide) nucleotide adenylyltransferase [Bacteroidales bacterium]